jgi:pimeloyl-ACP methyl ester carboxylesterase
MDVDERLAGVPEPDPDLEPQGFVVDVDGTRIHFLDWGGPSAGLRDILLIHGLGQTAWSWTPVARRLARTTRVVAMDLRGHGLSDAPTGEYHLEVLAEDAIAVIDGAGLAGGVVVAGHGFGGIVGAWAAGALEAEGGGRAAGLVLVDGGWEDIAATSGMEPEEWLPALDEPPEVLRSMAAFLADRREFDPSTWDADQEQAARATVVEVPAGHLVPATRPHALAASVRAMFDHRPASVLPALGIPVAALVSDDPDGSRAAALGQLSDMRAAAGGPPIDVTVFRGTGHNLMRYRPREVAAAIGGLARTIGR